MKLILVDFDGVIVDTFKMSHGILSNMGSGSFSEDRYRQIFEENPYRAAEIQERLKGHLTSKSPFFEKYTEGLAKRTPIEGIRKCIEELADIAPLAIVSSTIDDAIELFLEQSDLRHFFQKIYGVNSEKSKVKKIQQALEDFQAAPEDVVFITDTLGDIREAEKAGVQSVAVTWGYHDAKTLQDGNPIAIVNAPKDLVPAIRNLA